MSEYKENTVGWWLNRLKEPLRSRAISNLADECLELSAATVADAIYPMLDGYEDAQFWDGVHRFFAGDPKDGCQYRVMEGWMWAKECAPELGGGVESCISTEGDSVRLREATAEEAGLFSPVLGPARINDPSGRTFYTIKPDGSVDIPPDSPFFQYLKRLENAEARVSELEKGMGEIVKTMINAGFYKE